MEDGEATGTGMNDADLLVPDGEDGEAMGEGMSYADLIESDTDVGHGVKVAFPGPPNSVPPSLPHISESYPTPTSTNIPFENVVSPL